MADWRDLGCELDIWRQGERPATFWWRDDDATEPSDPLSIMLELVGKYSAPLALAVIPAMAKPELREVVGSYPTISILQHGFSHTNHAPPGEKKIEIGAHREWDVVSGQLASGLAEIEKFPASQPVLVPPWNRIDPAIFSRLPDIGYKGVSVFGRRQASHAAPGLVCINTHIDIIDWHGTRGFVGTGVALDLIIAHLAARRSGMAEADEATGLLSHHLVHDDECWRFIDEFLDFLGHHEAARLINIFEALTP